MNGKKIKDKLFIGLIISIILLFVGNSNSLYSQDMPFESAKKSYMKNHLQKLPNNMQYDEYKKMLRELNWKRVMVASVIPGYIHFYAEHNKSAWGIFAGRMIGGALMGYALYDQVQIVDDSSSSFFFFDGSTADNKDRSVRNLNLFSIGLVMNIIGYAIDWAHGDWIIEKERNEVLYKYGLLKNWDFGVDFKQDGNNDTKVTLGLNYKF